MPCYDERNSPEAIREESTREINRLTRVACDMWHVIKHVRMVHMLTEESKKWGADHDEADERREALRERNLKRQEQKREALRKLTREEKKLLGLL